MRKFSIALTLSILTCTTMPFVQIDRVHAIEQTSRDATLDLGVQQFQDGEYDRAIQTYQQVLERALFHHSSHAKIKTRFSNSYCKNG